MIDHLRTPRSWPNRLSHQVVSNFSTKIAIDSVCTTLLSTYTAETHLAYFIQATGLYQLLELPIFLSTHDLSRPEQ